MIGDGATAHPFNWAAFTIIGDGAGSTRAAVAPDAAAPVIGGRT
jgi:hypothetical protein